MALLHLEVEGEVQVSRMLSRTTERVKHLGPFYDEAAKILSRSVKEQLSSEGGRSEHTWQPLSPGYAEWKQRRYGNAPILEASGTMRRALQPTPEVVPDDKIFWSVPFYALFHQRGTRKMPQRRILDLNESDRRRLVKALQRHIMGAGIGR